MNLLFSIQLGDFDETADGFEDFVYEICDCLDCFCELDYGYADCIEDKYIKGKSCYIKDIPEEILKDISNQVQNFAGFQMVFNLIEEPWKTVGYILFDVDGEIIICDDIENKRYTL